jgi:phosphate starvation-inducible PhoH-like protein
MPSVTLTYETPQFLQKLIGNDLATLRGIGEAFGVHLTSREAWVKIDGEDDHVIAQARDVFVQLERVRRQGGDVTPAMVRLVTESVQRDAGDSPAEAIMHLKLLSTGKKPPVLAKTRGQIAYVQAMRESEVVFGIGPAGTGKTFLAVAAGVGALLRGEVERLIVSRPAVEAGERLGFLPGDLTEKVDPYMAPVWEALTDILGVDQFRRRREKGEIELAPIAFMRGRTLSHAYVIVDEAQNCSRMQMRMVLTRLGEGAKMVVTGDPSQIDLPHPRDSGLAHAVSLLEGEKGIGVARFGPEDVVRHPLVERIVRAYEADGRRPDPGS